MKNEKRQLRIGELAQELGVEKFVIRFWEKEFGIKSPRTDGQQRLYSEQDVAFFKEIKSLLYNQGFTISGAKKQLALNKSATTLKPCTKSVMEETQKNSLNDIQAQSSSTALQPSKDLTDQLALIQKQLLKLRELLQ